VLNPAGTHLVKIAFPGHFASEASDARLSFHLDQHSQPGLDHSPLGLKTRRPHGLLDKPVLNDNVRPHGRPPL